MNAVIDIGNTQTKLGLFDEDKLLQSKKFNTLSEVNSFLKQNPVGDCIISSVRQTEGEILQALSAIDNPLFLKQDTILPFKNNYQSKTLGLDRIAAVAGAQKLYPEDNSLIIDAGSCITYDLLLSGNTYNGGAISPGLKMRLKSMHNFTARLPLIEPRSVEKWISNTTEEAMLSGVVFGIVAEMEAFIKEMHIKYQPITVIITGGDTNFFESKIKATIFANSEIVLIGLNAILRYNASI